MLSTILWGIIVAVIAIWMISLALRPLQRTNRTAVSAIVWTIVALLAVFWAVGVFLVDLDQFAWIALIVAVAIAAFEVLSRRRRPAY